MRPIAIKRAAMRAIFGVTLACTSGCIHPMVRYHKARLLDPLMDPAKTSGLDAAMLSQPMTGVEHAASIQGGVSGGTCPTCGG